MQLTMPRSASSVTTAPLLRMRVAFSAPIITGMFRLMPAMAPGPLGLESSRIRPLALRTRGRSALLVWERCV